MIIFNYDKSDKSLNNAGIIKIEHLWNRLKRQLISSTLSDHIKVSRIPCESGIDNSQWRSLKIRFQSL